MTWRKEHNVRFLNLPMINIGGRTGWDEDLVILQWDIDRLGDNLANGV